MPAQGHEIGVGAARAETATGSVSCTELGFDRVAAAERCNPQRFEEGLSMILVLVGAVFGFGRASLNSASLKKDFDKSIHEIVWLSGMIC